MPRTKAQYEEMRQATRDKIQDAASYLFSKKGVAGTGVQEIADRAGISIGLLYRHYKTKDELFAELIHSATDGLEQLTSAFSSEGDPREILMAVTNEVIDDFKKGDEFGDYLTFITQAFTSGMKSEALEALLAQDKKLILALARLIQRGQREGGFRSGDPHAMAALYMSAVQGLGLFQSVMKSDFPLPSAGLLLSFLFET